MLTSQMLKPHCSSQDWRCDRVSAGLPYSHIARARASSAAVQCWGLWLLAAALALFVMAFTQKEEIGGLPGLVALMCTSCFHVCGGRMSCVGSVQASASSAVAGVLPLI